MNDRKFVTEDNSMQVKVIIGIALFFVLLVYPGWLRTAIQSQNLESKRQAELAAAISKGSKKIPKYGSSGSYLTVPDFSKYDKK